VIFLIGDLGRINNVIGSALPFLGSKGLHTAWMLFLLLLVQGQTQVEIYQLKNEEQWAKVLRNFLLPIQSRKSTGYFPSTNVRMNHKKARESINEDNGGTWILKGTPKIFAIC
jgi:hypothetical protein